MAVWQSSVQRAQQEGALTLTTAVQELQNDRGKAVLEDGHEHVATRETGISDADVAKLIRERDEAIEKANVHAAKRRKAHILVIRQKEQMERLCFWLEQTAHSFSLTLPPQPPFWKEADKFLSRHYQRHVLFVDLPHAPK